VARTLRSVPLLGSRRPCRHRASSFRTRSRSPAGVPSRRWSGARSRVTTPRCAALDLRAFFHRGVRCVRATLPSRDRSMLPWALDRLVPDAAALVALPSSRWTFRLAVRTASASPHPNVKERQGVSVLSGSMRPTSGCPRRDHPGQSRWLRRFPKEPPRPHPRRATKGMPVNPPREEVHRVGPYTRRHPVSDVIATHLRRDSFATQRSLRRAAAGGSSSFPPSFRGCPRT
jgi:hypothetical protein